MRSLSPGCRLYRVRGFCSTGAALYALLLLAGCSLNSDRQKNFPLSEAPQKEVAAQDAADSSSAGDDADSSDSEDTDTEVTDADEDKQAKEDLYWKLDYLKQVSVTGLLPDDFGATVKDIKFQVDATADDEKKQMIEEIVDHFQDAAEADALLRQIKLAGFSVTKIPWGIGNMTMEERFKNDPGIPGDMRDKTRNTMDESLRTQILAYENHHHASPATVKQSALLAGVSAIPRLHDLLNIKDPQSLQDDSTLDDPTLDDPTLNDTLPNDTKTH